MVRLCLFVRLSISVPLQLWLSLRFLRWRIRWCIWRRLSPRGLSSKVLSPGGLSSRVLARGRLSWWWLSRRWLSRRELSRRGWTPLRWASVTDTPTRHGATGQYARPSEAEQMARNTAMAGWGLAWCMDAPLGLSITYSVASARVAPKIRDFLTLRSAGTMNANFCRMLTF